MKDAFGVDRTAVSKAGPMQVARSAAKATKVGVGQGGTVKQRMAAHGGIATGHATTAGGLAMGATGVATGYALAKKPKSSTPAPAKPPMALAKALTAEQKTVKEKNRRRTTAVFGAAGAGVAAQTGLAAAGGRDVVRASKATKNAQAAYNTSRGARKQGFDHIARLAQETGDDEIKRASGLGLRGVKNLKRSTAVGAATLGLGLPAIAATSYKNQKDWKAASGKVAKADWKTIEQRERAQGRNRKNAREVASWGSTAAILGGGYTYLSPRAQSDIGRMGTNAKSGYQFRRSTNAQLGMLGVGGMPGNKAGDVVRGAKAAAATPKAGKGKTALALMAGGIAAGAGANAVAGSRNKYHQHKINERRRANHQRSKAVSKSAFGIEHGSISKSDKRVQDKHYMLRPSTSNTRGENAKAGAVGAGTVGALYGGALGAVAGSPKYGFGRRSSKTVDVQTRKPGKKTRTAAWSDAHVAGKAGKHTPMRQFRVPTFPKTRGAAAGAAVGGAAFGAYGAGVGALMEPKKSKVKKDAFGVVAKKEYKPVKGGSEGKPSAGRRAAAQLFPGYHGLAMGKKGHKLKAAGHQVGGIYAGLAAGGVPGAVAGGLIGRKVGGAEGAAAGAGIGGAIGGHAGARVGLDRGTVIANKKGYYKREDRD
jgi:hypothetical protein